MGVGEWVAAVDDRVRRVGTWRETSLRHAESGCLQGAAGGSRLEVFLDGADLALRFGQHAPPVYGKPDRGRVAVRVDGGPERVFQPLETAREVVVARGLAAGGHRVVVECRGDGPGETVSLEAFGSSRAQTGEIAFLLAGENNAWLVDARAVLFHGGRPVVNRLVRNWLTGGCRLALLPPGRGYRLEVRALGWQTAVVEGITVTAGGETVLPPVYLAAMPGADAGHWLFPRLGRQAVARPGEGFRVRLQTRGGEVTGLYARRRAGPAVVSRALAFREEAGAAYYYDREFRACLPADTPPGLYDLEARFRAVDSGEEKRWLSPRAVMVVADYPRDPVFVSWGHLDTQGQFQAEYLRRLVEVANLAGADMVLAANECNPAYVAGALAGLAVPHAVNFGNHRFPGAGRWFGPGEGVIDLGPGLCVLNRSLPWHEGTAGIRALLAAREGAALKVINAFEPNAPVDLLDRYRVALVHDGHGPGRKVAPVGATPTLRVGKVSPSSFRIIRFRDRRLVSATYAGGEVDPIPFPRGAAAPLRSALDRPAGGEGRGVGVTVTNELAEPFPGCRLAVVLPRGEYACAGGRIESAATSDCGGFTVLSLRVDAAARGETAARVYPRRSPAGGESGGVVK